MGLIGGPMGIIIIVAAGESHRQALRAQDRRAMYQCIYNSIDDKI